jgi:hypothetical protein
MSLGREQVSLAEDFDHLTDFHRSNRVDDLRNQRPQILDAIANVDNDHCADPDLREVLLVFSACCPP